VAAAPRIQRLPVAGAAAAAGGLDADAPDARGPGDDELPAEPGSYVLLLHAAGPRRAELGRFGSRELERGWYLYLGSAFGPGGLRARLGHHLAASPRPHWHIDHLKAVLPIRELWFCRGARLESEWAAALAAHPWSRVPLPGFGASDARGEEHLFHFRRRPAPRWLRGG